jgi:thiol-disulfide isomerase/thioredoxin
MNRKRIRAGGLLAVAGASWLAACAAERAIDPPGCALVAAEDAALAAARKVLPECEDDVACWDRHWREAEARVVASPRSFAAHRVLVTLAQPHPGAAGIERRAELRRRYDRMIERHPRDPAPRVLRAHLDYDTAARLERATSALEIDPSFAWAHRLAAQAILGFRPGPEARDEARPHVEAFSAACPERVEDRLELLDRLGDADLFARETPDLRARIGPAVSRFANLAQFWNLRLRFAPPAQHEALRAEARADLAVLRALDRTSDREWLWEVNDLAHYAGDDGMVAWVDDTWSRRWPCSREGIDIRLGRIPGLRTMREPFDEAGPASEGAILPALREIVAQCPDAEAAWWELLTRVIDHSPRDEAEVARAASAYERLASIRNLENVAPVLVWEGVELPRVARWIDRIEDELAVERRHLGERGVAAAEADRRLAERRYRLELLRARIALSGGDGAGADAALARAERLLPALEDPASQDAARARSMLAWWTSELDSLRGRLAASRGAHEAALDHFRRALAANPELPEPEQAARSSWVALRGGEGGWVEWLEVARAEGRIAVESSISSARRPLPELELPDLAGRIWSRADFSGKTSVLAVWATWCGPCKGEMPLLDRLHDEWRDGGRFQVVTVSVDRSPALVAPYLEREQLDFPVLLSGEDLFRAWDFDSIPRTFVVDPAGTIVAELVGFGSDEAGFERRLRELVERAASGAA